MTSHPHECEWCHQGWTNAISAALCCDPASFGEDDEPPTVLRGLD